MKPWRFYLAVALTWIMQDLRDFLAKVGRGTFALTGKVFGTPTREKRLRLSRIPFTRRRLHYLARLARVELSAARDLGTSAKELLREGHPEVARRASKFAYLHWRKARKVFARMQAVA
jgi:hypothetical protein